jgi:hypothetical protein
MYSEVYNGVEFDQKLFHVCGGLRPVPEMNVHLSTNFGDRVDYSNTRAGDYLTLGAYVDYNVSRHLFADFGQSFERLDVSGGRLYTAYVSELSLVYHFNVRTFLRVILQYADTQLNPALYTFEVPPEDDHLFSQILFSYKVNPRTVFYLGYTDDYYGDHEVKLTQANRTFFTKLGYAWVR